MSLKTYDFKKCEMVFGPVVVSGFSEGSAVTFTPEAEVFTAKVGADGQTTRSRSNNDNYKCTFRLMQTSDSLNQVQLLTLRNSALSNQTYPFKFVSPTTGESYTCANAYVERLPDAEFADEAGEREYTLYLPSCKVGTVEVLASLFRFLG